MFSRLTRGGHVAAPLLDDIAEPVLPLSPDEQRHIMGRDGDSRVRTQLRATDGNSGEGSGPPWG